MTLLSLPLLDLHMDSWAYTPNGTQLLVDGDMEAAGTAAWAGVGAGVVLSKQTGTPHSGTQCLRVATTLAAVALARPLPAPTTIGRTYRVTGWARGSVNPVLMDYDARILWTGTASPTWQYFDITYVAVTTFGPCLWDASGAAGSYTEWDDITLELCPASTRNIGSLGGVALVGDGVTTTTFPTQLAPHGMSYDGGDYLALSGATSPSFATLVGDELPFSIETLFICTNYTSIKTLACKGLWATGSEWIIHLDAGTISFLLIDSTTGAYLQCASNARVFAPANKITHLVCSYDGTRVNTGMQNYTDGVVNPVVRGSGGVYTRMVNSGRPTYVAYPSGAGGTYLPGSVFNYAIYPWALTPSQVAQCYDRRKRMLQVY